jgi:hypothetical protein
MACDRGICQPNLGTRTCDRGRCRRIERRVKGQVAQRAQAVVSDDLCLRIELPGGIALMEMGEGQDLGGDNQGGADERNRLCAAANQRPNSSPPANHQSITIIAEMLRRYPPA